MKVGRSEEESSNTIVPSKPSREPSGNTLKGCLSRKLRIENMLPP